MREKNFKRMYRKGKITVLYTGIFTFPDNREENCEQFQKVFYSSQFLRCVEGNISKEGNPFISRDDRETIND